MASQTVNSNGNYSDPIEVTGNSLVIRVEMSVPGGIILERSITGDKYVSEEVFSSHYRQLKIIERGITGLVPGQFLRLRFERSEASLITVLQ